MSKNRITIVREYIVEGYGAGFSVSSFRGGMAGMGKNSFGGASNLGGPNMMYTYEIKPLNHTLEQLPNMLLNRSEIQIGSVITGELVRSNANPEPGRKVTGVVHKIVITDNGAIKYYVIQDRATQINMKIDPLTASLIIPEPVEYYAETDTLPRRRKEKLKNAMKENKLVAESIEEYLS